MFAGVGVGRTHADDEELQLPSCVAVTGLVIAHDHMYQWATRGYVPDGGLFEWLRALYPVWARIDADTVRIAARAAMARLLLSGCTLSTDHHYVFPRGREGIFEALVETASELGLRFHPCRGSMSLGESKGGLPPDSVDEERFCLEKFGRRPLDLMQELGWTGDDVWFAHGVHFSDADVATVAATRTGVAHCPSSNLRLGAGVFRLADLVRAGARVGLGVDGAASNEDSNLAMEVHQALLLARGRAAVQGDPDAATALGARGAWRLATAGGAACLGRGDRGTLEPGKCADVAFFRIDGLAHAGIEDPLAALALAPPARAEAVVVNGKVVVRDGRLVTGDEHQIARDIALESRRLRTRA